MLSKVSRAAATLASAAVLSLMATPVLARDRGWGGWGGRHHDRVDVGDVFAGLLIIGGIAAIASAASKAGKNRQARVRESYPADRGDDGYYRSDDTTDQRPQWNAGNDLNAAVDRCVGEIERGKARVDSVDTVNRDGQGWRVQGRVSGSGNFACTVDTDGRIRSISMDGHAL